MRIDNTKDYLGVLMIQQGLGVDPMGSIEPPDDGLCIKDIVEFSGLSNESFAEAIEVSKGTLSRYISGDMPVPEKRIKRMIDIAISTRSVIDGDLHCWHRGRYIQIYRIINGLGAQDSASELPR